MFTKIEVYLNPEEVAKLLAMLKKAPVTYQELLAQKKKASILQ